MTNKKLTNTELISITASIAVACRDQTIYKLTTFAIIVTYSSPKTSL